MGFLLLGVDRILETVELLASLYGRCGAAL